MKRSSAYAAGVSAHGADLGLVEANPLAVARDQRYIHVSGGQADVHQPVALLDADGADSVGANVGERFERGLLDRAGASREEDVQLRVEFGDR